jgi:hypothetical protein
MKKLIFIKTKAQNWEQNHKSNSDEIDDASISLKRKTSCQRFYCARNQKSNLNINGILEITIVDNQ